MVDLLTIDEASLETGIPTKSLYNAVAAGRLPADWQDGVRVVTEGALSAYAARYKPQDVTRWSRPWTEADIAALMELYDSCTSAQIAAYLGRGVSAVGIKMTRLRQKGLLTKKPRRAGWTKANPFGMPSTGILVARTCSKCGLLRDAVHFTERTGRGRGGRDTWCIRCRRAYARDSARDKAAKVGYPRRRALQAATEVSATNRGQEYTSADLEVVSDMSKPAFVVALELGRTYKGILTQRARMGLRSRAKNRALPADTHWVIDFPNAAVVLREHYRALGVVDESEWDWTDDVAV